MSTSTLFERGYQGFVNLDAMSVGKNVAKFRDLAGLKQHELAKAIGVRQNTISAIEIGKTKKSRFLPEIARVLGCSLADLDPSIQRASLVIHVSGRQDVHKLVAANEKAAYEQGRRDAIRDMLDAAEQIRKRA